LKAWWGTCPGADGQAPGRRTGPAGATSAPDLLYVDPSRYRARQADICFLHPPSPERKVRYRPPRQELLLKGVESGRSLGAEQGAVPVIEPFPFLRFSTWIRWFGKGDLGTGFGKVAPINAASPRCGTVFPLNTRLWEAEPAASDSGGWSASLAGGRAKITDGAATEYASKSAPAARGRPARRRAPRPAP